MDRPLIVLIPGLALPPSRYEVFLGTFTEILGAETRGYLPPGVGSRFPDQAPVSPEGMAAELLASLATLQGPRVFIGHSVGAHAARAAARSDPECRALVLLDPNLGETGRYDPRDFDAPAILSGWAELDAIYQEAGIRNEHVLREWWRERPDGTLERAFDLETIRAQLAALAHGPAILDEIHELSERLPVAVVWTIATSVNTQAAWDQLKLIAPRVEILDVEFHHALPVGEQRMVAQGIIEWLDAHPDPAGYGEAVPEQSGWRAVFGRAASAEIAEVDRVVDEEFSGVNPEEGE